jgi:alkylated DNA repair dioxygenase AlkB
MSQERDLPEPPLLVQEDFVTEAQELYERLVAEILWDERMKARKTACYGEAYNYSGITYDTIAMHPALVPLVDKLEAKLGYRPNSCLLNYYADGNATMGFHSDSEEDIVPGTGIAIVSLGAERTLTFRSKQEKQNEHAYRLGSGSLLYMPPGVQDDWKHAVLPQENTSGRISATFRLLRRLP